jgi:drug/metabolite transporter (DMT)-like permease
VLGQRPTGALAASLGVLCAGVLLVSGGGQIAPGAAHGAGVLLGDALFLISALVWAGYTLAARGGSTQPIHWVALVAVWNAPVAALIWAFTPGTLLTHVAQTQAEFLAWQVLIQGVVAAIGGNWMFLLAVKRLGVVTTSASGAAVPACVALGGVWALGEALAPLQILGIALTVAGIWAASVLGARSRLHSEEPTEQTHQRVS